MAYIEQIQDTIRREHGCRANHVDSVSLTETGECGGIVWQGLVEVFDLEGHPEAKRCYAWRLADDAKDGQPRIVTELAIRPVNSPSDAVRRVEFIRRHMANAASMTFGMLDAQVLPVDGGWREARICDGEFAGWLCPHVHATREEAGNCPDRRSMLARDEGE